MHQESLRGNRNPQEAPRRIEAKAPVAEEELEIVGLRPSQLVVDRAHHVQRPLIDRHVKSLAADFSPALFGMGSVSLRADGKFYILDSQHRCEAAKASGHGDREFPFRVWRGLSIQQEADLFQKLNGKHIRDSAINSFLVGVEARYPTNIGIMRILQSFGMTVGAGRSEGVIQAVDALVKIYEGRVKGPKKAPAKNGPAPLPPGHLLSRTLMILTAAWGFDRDAFEVTLLIAVAMMLAKHDTAVDSARLSKLMAKAGAPKFAIGQIRTLAATAHVGHGAAGVQYLEGIYNRKLPEERRLS